MRLGPDEDLIPEASWEEAPQRLAVVPKPSDVKFYVGLFLWVWWAIFWGLLGCFGFLTVLLAPFGVWCFAVAAWPLYRMIAKRNHQMVAWDDYRSTHGV